MRPAAAPQPALAGRVRACALAAFVVLALSAWPAFGAPQAKILRIDPRASIEDGAPVLTTVIDLVQHTALSDITAKCAQLTGMANLGCVAAELDKPRALYKPFKFPSDSAIFTVNVDDRDIPARLIDPAESAITRWGERKKTDDGIGTAWLFVIDAANSMEGRFDEAKAVARAFINKMDAHDIAKVMFFNDADIVRKNNWTNKKQGALSFVDSVPGIFPAQSGRARPLFQIIRKAATDGFQELGNVGTDVDVPMHQAMVVLSNGLAGTDMGGPAPAASALSDYMTKGRFPEDNTTLPKSPVPVISIWFPKKDYEEYFENARQFMENLANPQIGGYHNIVLPGQADRANAIVQAVVQRFDEMHIVKWRVPCIAPKVSQTFNLVFKDLDTPVAGDGTFKNVPVGIDPTTWPLDIDVDQTKTTAKKEKVHPGGTVKIFGNFCWGSDHKRAQLYLIPKNQPAPESLKGRTVEEAQKAQQTLIASNLVGKATTATDNFVEFEVPDTTKFLRGTGKELTAQMVVVDSRSKRSSAITADKILELPAEKKPLNLILIGGLTFGGVILILLIIQIFRGGGSRRRGRTQAAPPPVVAPQYPPGPGGYPPQPPR
jgi:hypothetical protein